MRFVYLDPGLINEAGHHANLCGYIAGAVRTAGIPVEIYASQRIAPELATRLQAKPFFRFSPYQLVAPPHDRGWDPVSGWLNHFDIVWRATREDLNSLGELGPLDVIYVSAAWPPQLMAICDWFAAIPSNRRPKVVVELSMDSGVVITNANGQVEIQVPDPRIDFRAMLFRYVSKFLARDFRSQLKLVALSSATVESYRVLIDYPVEEWPMPQDPATDCHSRVGKRAFTVSFLGHQRPEKGYRLVPEICAQLLAQRKDIAVLVHNGAPDQMPDVQQILRGMASNEPRLVVNELTPGPELWAQFLDVSDLIVCPYDPVAFAKRGSGITNEAIANAIPVIVPNHTYPAEVLAEFDYPGTTFDQHTPSDVTKAALKILSSYDDYAERAHQASRRYSANRGSAKFLEKLLECQPAWQQSSRAAMEVFSVRPRRANENTSSTTLPVAEKSPRVLVSWYTDPRYIPPFQLSPRQVTLGPEVDPEARRDPHYCYSAITPTLKTYDLKEFCERNGIFGPFDALVVWSDASLANLPVNLKAFNCPTVLCVGDTQHLTAPLESMLAYAKAAGFDYIVSSHNRHHLHWFAESGFFNVAWIPGLKAQHLPRAIRTNRNRTMAFVGQTGRWHVRRSRIVEELKSRGLPLMAQEGSRTFAADLYASSTLSFNLSLNGDLNLRTFEILSAGGCLVTDRLSPESGLPLLLEDGKDYLGYSSVDELVEIAERYLDNPKEALAIAKQGNKTYTSRYLPEFQVAALHDWIFSGTLSDQYRIAWDLRPAIAEEFPAPFEDRVKIYQLLQQAHLVEDTVDVLVSGDTPLSFVADMIDLPRLRCSLYDPHDKAKSQLSEYGMQSRVSVLRSETELAGKQWRFAIDTRETNALERVKCDQRITIESVAVAVPA